MTPAAAFATVVSGTAGTAIRAVFGSSAFAVFIG
jgi:hypothetical protein